MAAPSIARNQHTGQGRSGSRSTGNALMWADGDGVAFFPGQGSLSPGFHGIAAADDEAGAPRLADQECKWIVWDAPEILQEDAAFARCGPAFSGLHYLLGFHTACSRSGDRGRIFAERLDAGDRVRDAWIHACTETEDANTWWAYMRADAPETDTFSDHWCGKGYTSPDPVSPTVRYYMRGSC